VLRSAFWRTTTPSATRLGRQPLDLSVHALAHLSAVTSAWAHPFGGEGTDGRASPASDALVPCTADGQPQSQ